MNNFEFSYCEKDIKSTQLETIRYITKLAELNRWLEDWKKTDTDKLNAGYLLRCTGIKRADKQVSDVASLLVIDGDSRIDLETGEERKGCVDPAIVHQALKDNQISHIIYTSHSHGKVENNEALNKFRVLIPYRYQRTELKSLVDCIIGLLHDNQVMIASVKENYTWAQAWFLPCVHPERANLFKQFFYNGGNDEAVEQQHLAWLKKTITPHEETASQGSNPNERNPIVEFNTAYTVFSVLERNGYQWQKGTRKLISPNSTSGAAGITALTDTHIYSHHNDVLNTGKALDAFDCYRLLECGGDLKQALNWNPDITQHNQREYAKARKTSPAPKQDNTVIEDTLTKLCDDVAAWHTPEFIAALHGVYVTDQQAYLRIYAKLKAFKVATEVKRAIEAFDKKHKSEAKRTQFNAPPSTVANPLLREMVDRFSLGVLVGYDDKGNAVRTVESEAAMLIARHTQHSIAYSAQAKAWHIFTGTHWQIDDSKQIDKILIDLLYRGTNGLGFSNAYRNNITCLCTDGGQLPLPETQHGLLPFQNGLLDCKTQAFHPITPSNAQTWCLPYHYDKQADCSNIKYFLLQAVNGDNDTVQFLRAWLAGLLHGRADLQKFLHLIGIANR